MIVLISKVRQVAEAATTGEQFYNKQGQLGPLVYTEGVMPADQEPGGSAPFGLVQERGFTLFPSRTQQVQVVFAICNNDRSGGLADVERIMSTAGDALGKAGQYSPWKLQNVEGWTGGDSPGPQPHPTYFITFLLSFTGAARKRGTT